MKRIGLKLYFSLSLPCLAALTFGASSAAAQGAAPASSQAQGANTVAGSQAQDANTLAGSQAQDANAVTIISTQYRALPEYRITVGSGGGDHGYHAAALSEEGHRAGRPDDGFQPATLFP